MEQWLAIGTTVVEPHSVPEEATVEKMKVISSIMDNKRSGQGRYALVNAHRRKACYVVENCPV